MKHSESLNEIAKAMSKLQNEIRDAEKDTQGYGYKYADLGQVLSLIRPLLEKNGLSFSQHVGNASESVVIETIVMHESGQWMSSELSMPVTMEPKRSAAQCVGIAITYGRRYSLTAAFGITQVAEDQDGETKEKPVAQAPKRAQAEPPVVSSVGSAFLTKDQVFKLSEKVFKAKINPKEIYDKYNVKSYEQLTNAQAKEIGTECDLRLASV